MRYIDEANSVNLLDFVIRRRALGNAYINGI